MSFPWGTIGDIAPLFIAGQPLRILGCLSFEQRCRNVPEYLKMYSPREICLVDIREPTDSFPNRSPAIRFLKEQNRRALEQAGVTVNSPEASLLASVDELDALLRDWVTQDQDAVVVLDITAFPKRYFCFFLKQLMQARGVKNMLVTYTEVGPDGYAEDLAEDFMPCDLLPGFRAGLPAPGGRLVISVGFEPINIDSLLEATQEDGRDMRFLTAFPPVGQYDRRQFRTLMEITGEKSRTLNAADREVVAAWDVEEVFLTLGRWSRSCNRLALAPFGPKPHTLAMALFAIQSDPGSGLYYTQPKSYNPEYSRGSGTIWAYVTKWNGTPCLVDNP